MIKASALKECSMESVEREEILSNYLQQGQNIVIGKTDEEVIPESIAELAKKLMKNSNLLKNSINVIRENYSKKREDFHIDLSEKTDAERETITNLFEDMLGIVTLLHYEPETNMLNGRISLSLPKAQMFIMGQYLEIALFEKTKNILANITDECGIKYNIYRNVKVTDRNGKYVNEFDLVIKSESEKVYVVEIKSGKCFRDFEKYSSIGRSYGVVPNRFLLVDNYLSSEQCDITQYFCEYYVCNLEGDSFERKLEKMIKDDMKGVEND